MSGRLARLWSMFVLVAFVACGGGGPTPVPPGPIGFAECPTIGTPELVTPNVACVLDDGAARTIVFGYRNEGASTAVIPVGASNRYSLDLDPRLITGAVRPPSSFAPGDHPAAFAVTYLPVFGDLAWQLGLKSASAAGAPTCAKTVNASTGETRLQVADAEGGASIVVARNSAAALAATVQPTATPLDGFAVGETSGSMSVGADGSASYTIPITVPVGRAAMQPDLALVYGSRAGNGPLGVGWTLAGLSLIARCPKTLATDPAAVPVQFNDTDRFCLDGDPLVGDLAAGASPLHDPFTRVRVERDGSGPSAFVVEMQNGRILRYGGGAEHRLEGKRTAFTRDGVEDVARRADVRLAFLLTEVRDRVGNSIQYRYAASDIPEDQQGCTLDQPIPCFAYEKRIVDISYTHRPSGGGAVKRVAFEYDDVREDSDLAYVSGFALKRTGRLRTIITSAPMSAGPQLATSIVRKYLLEYATAPLSGRTLLASVQECDGGNACKKATTFDYEPGAPTFHEGPMLGELDTFGAPGVGVAAGEGAVLVADFNGDGLDDLLYTRSSRWRLRLNTTTDPAVPTFAAEVTPDIPVLNAATDAPTIPSAVDLNHDGKFDLTFVQVFSTPPAGLSCDKFHIERTRAFTLEGGSFVPLAGHDETPWAGFPAGVTVCHEQVTVSYSFADLNGDGRTDTVTWQYITFDPTGAWRVALSRPPPAVPAPFMPLSNAAPDALPLAAPVGGSRAWTFFIARDNRYEATDAVSFASPTPTPLLTTNSLAFGDTNGDGTADVFARKPGSPETKLHVATGSGFRTTSVPMPVTNSGATPAWRPAPGPALGFDYFQDGRTAWLVDSVYGSPGPGSTANDLARPLLRVRPLREPEWLAAPSLSGVADTTIASLRANQRFSRLVDANGDGLDDLILADGGRWRVFVRDGKRADLLRSVTTALGDVTRVEYATTRGNWSDASACGSEAGVACGSRGVTVASRIERHATFGGSRRSHAYKFANASSAIDTGAFLGFASMVVTDEQTGAVTTTRFDRRGERFTDGEAKHFPYVMMPTSVDIVSPLAGGRKVTSTTTYDYGASSDLAALRPETSKAFRVALAALHVGEVEVSTAGTVTLRADSTTYKHDRFGNTTEIVTSIPGAQTTNRTTLTWRNDLARWLLAIPELEERSSVVTDPLAPGSVTRRVRYEVEPTTGLLRVLTSEPELGLLSSTREMVRDGVGNVIAHIVRDAAGAVRRTDITFDEIDGTFPTRSIDSMGYVQQFVFHPGLGVLAESTDPNGVRMRFRYDGFGKLRRVMSPVCTAGVDLTGTSCSGASVAFEEFLPPTGGVYGVRRIEPGRPEQTTLYDALGRVTRGDVVGFDGQPQSTLYSYDSTHIDRLAEARELLGGSFDSGPFSLSRASRVEYDLLGRPTRFTAANGGMTRWAYEGRRTTVFGPVGTEKSEVRDLLGRVAHTADLLTSPKTKELRTTFRYTAFGQLASVSDAEGNQTRFRYDTLGRRTTVTDATSGTTTYEWNAFGDMLATTDALGRKHEYAYDPLGRRVGERAVDGITCLQYDGAPGGIGALTGSVRLDGTEGSRIPVIQRSELDLLGRTMRLHQTIGGGPDLEFTFGYDTLGRLARTTYPEVEGAGLKARYNYNARGYLWTISDETSGVSSNPLEDAPALWRAVERDRLGQLTKEQFGNGVTTTHTYDPNSSTLAASTSRTALGAVVADLAYEYRLDNRLQRRTDRLIASRDDRFSYDSLNRLSRWRGPWGSISYDYDDLGNLETRTRSTSGKSHVEKFVSGKSGLGAGPGKPAPPEPPHAVMRGPNGSYSYDEVGDQTEAPGRTATWTTFHLPRRVATSSTIATFLYDAGHGRVQERDDAGTAITTYAGGGLFELRESPGAKRMTFSVVAEGRTVVQLHKTVGGGVSNESFYLHADHLGSPHVITNGAGAVVEKRSHDPFGKRVSNDNPLQEPTPWTSPITVGFTGHEHDDDLGLINMRGRIFDPAVGRFTAPDPIVSTTSQGLNRYSYLGNDPMNGTDSTGFCRDTISGCFDSNPFPGFSGSFGFGGGGGSTGAPSHIGPTALPARPPIHAPRSPLTGGFGPIPSFSVGGFLGVQVPSLGGGYLMGGHKWREGAAGTAIVRSDGNAEDPTHRSSSRRYAAGVTNEPEVDISYNKFYNPDRIMTTHGYAIAKHVYRGSLAVGFAATGLGLVGIAAGGAWATIAGVSAYTGGAVATTGTAVIAVETAAIEGAAAGKVVADNATGDGAALGDEIMTVIGRMKDLQRFATDPKIDTWAKSGRIPAAGEPPIKWAENAQWIMERVNRGDRFGIATDPATLPARIGGFVPGAPNGYFTVKELYLLRSLGIEPVPLF